LIFPLVGPSRGDNRGGGFLPSLKGCNMATAKDIVDGDKKGMTWLEILDTDGDNRPASIL